MARPKGKPKTGGRKKGVVNKVTADIKTMVMGALAASGGQKYLQKQAKINPVAFMALVGKLIPLALKNDEGKPFVFASVDLDKFPAAEKMKILQSIMKE